MDAVQPFSADEISVESCDQHLFWDEIEESSTEWNRIEWIE